MLEILQSNTEYIQIISKLHVVKITFIPAQQIRDLL